MNFIISAVVGGLLATGLTIGGVSAYQPSPDPVPADELFTYADQ